MGLCKRKCAGRALLSIEACIRDKQLAYCMLWCSIHSSPFIHTVLVLSSILDVEPNECERLGGVPLFVARHSLGSLVVGRDSHRQSHIESSAVDSAS